MDQTNKLQARLLPILELLNRSELVETLTERQEQAHADLVNNLVHRQQLAELAKKLTKLRAAEVAHLLEMLPETKRMAVWEQLDHPIAADALTEVSDAVAESIIDESTPEELISLFSHLEIDEISEIADLLPQQILQQLKASLQSEEREWLEESLKYPDDSVGELMSKQSLQIYDVATVDQAIAQIRACAELPEQIDKIFVINRLRHFIGIVPVTDLLRHDGEKRLREIVQTDAITFLPGSDAEEAGQAFERYDLISAPVLDSRRRVIGRLTVESVMDFLREQAEEQAFAREGLSGDTDLFGPVWESARQRWAWLCVNLITAFCATRFISVFEDTITELVALATLMPIVASVGGNTGNQTIALFIRGLALDQIQKDNIRFIAAKELSISLINGLIWGTVLGGVAWALYQNLILGVVMLSATVLNLLIAASVGIGVPVLMDKLGKDPAMGSSVVLTFVTDSMGFFIFLGLATLWLI